VGPGWGRARGVGWGRWAVHGGCGKVGVWEEGGEVRRRQWVSRGFEDMWRWETGVVEFDVYKIHGLVRT